MTDHRTDPEEFAGNLADDADEQPAPALGGPAPAATSTRGGAQSADIDSEDRAGDAGLESPAKADDAAVNDDGADPADELRAQNPGQTTTADLASPGGE